MGNAQVAQLVEHATENRGVGGSIPPLGTTSPISLTLGDEFNYYSDLRLRLFTLLSVRVLQFG